EGVAADMIEMEMRINDEIDLRRVAAERFDTRADLLARVIIEIEEARKARAEPRRRIVLAVGMHAGVEEGRAVGVLDQIGRDRQADLALAALHQMGELARQMPAGKGVDLEAHDALSRVS